MNSSGLVRGVAVGSGVVTGVLQAVDAETEKLVAVSQVMFMVLFGAGRGSLPPAFGSERGHIVFLHEQCYLVHFFGFLKMKTQCPFLPGL